VFGPRQNPKGAYAAVIPLFIDAALKKQAPVINGDGETSRDFTFIENVVQANIKALFAKDIEKHEVFNIAFGERTTLNELWDKICIISNHTLKPSYKEERKGDVKHSLANINKAIEHMGYKPSISIYEGLKKAFHWYQTSDTKDE
jgi:UDP-N-acetylglucosamine 4-epimerase